VIRGQGAGGRNPGVGECGTNSGFKGKWFVRYKPDQFEYRDILAALADIHEGLAENQKEAAYKWIVFDKHVNKEGFSIEIGNGYDGMRNTHPDSMNIKPKIGDIKNVLLGHPALMNDKRWETIHFTSAGLFLGSALRNAGFNVSFRKLIMPVTSLNEVFRGENGDIDLLGLTLFEDVYKETREFLDRLPGVGFSGLLAAGGPMITLNPLQSAWNLPEVNLFVRGEAEFALPLLLNAMNANDPKALAAAKGFLFQIPGVIIISDLDHINRPGDFSGFRFHLDFLVEGSLEHGLEINLSRGCGRGCIFCSHVQGRTVRQLPAETFENLLEVFRGARAPRHGVPIKSFFKSPPLASKKADSYSETININDDDILQDMAYAERIFQLIKEHHYKLWGVQTSVNSFFRADHTIDYKIFDTLADGSLYVDNNPVVWVGTDAFLKERGKKLGKWIPPEEQMLALLGAFEERGIRNYHYWISSDYDTDWEEFAREFLYIYRLHSAYKTFDLIAHAPFLVPYSSTPLYRQLLRSTELQKRIKYKQILKAGKPVFEFPLVDRVETAYVYLNRLLSNEQWGNRLGFFDYLKQKDYLNAFIVLYDYLKQERISFESVHHPESLRLLETEKEVETFIATII
jgi:hypothetical protein